MDASLLAAFGHGKTSEYFRDGLSSSSLSAASGHRCYFRFCGLDRQLFASGLKMAMDSGRRRTTWTMYIQQRCNLFRNVPPLHHAMFPKSSNACADNARHTGESVPSAIAWRGKLQCVQVGANLLKHDVETRLRDQSSTNCSAAYRYSCLFLHYSTGASYPVQALDASLGVLRGGVFLRDKKAVTEVHQGCRLHEGAKPHTCHARSRSRAFVAWFVATPSSSLSSTEENEHIQNSPQTLQGELIVLRPVSWKQPVQPATCVLSLFFA